MLLSCYICISKNIVLSGLIRRPAQPVMQKIIVLLLTGLFAFAAQAQNTLDGYLQNAMKFSPVFIDNQTQINALAYDSMLIRAGLKPQVNFTSNDLYAPVVNGYGYDEIITNKGNYNAL